MRMYQTDGLRKQRRDRETRRSSWYGKALAKMAKESENRSKMIEQENADMDAEAKANS